jgi:non-specific serine/threonine protein kinase
MTLTSGDGPMIGRTLAHYRITAAIGAGGMGQVYRATDTKLDREVALKVLPGELAASADMLARFRREARAVASLNHPHVVTIHSVEEADGVHFLTMELIEGQSLSALIPAGGMALPQIVSIATSLADALSAAHDKGIIHRDLKPANIMVTRDGVVKVLDFGLAKLADPETVEASPDQSTRMKTEDGIIMGTRPYMSPEQVQGAPLDHRTDIFSLGVVLHEMTTGRRPFQGKTSADLFAAILRDPAPAVAELRSDVPSDLSSVIRRCLEKDPRKRIQTALDVSNELRRARPAREAVAVLKPPPVPATPLLGRDETLRAAAERVQRGARLLTITGYGGTGKTRFSIELFSRLAPAYEGGAAFVSLASVTASAEVLPTIGIALEIAEAQGRSALEALGTVIGDRRLLLVLDNLEQVLGAAPDIAALVSRCPSLQVIATSRAPLKVGVETEFPLPPLALPAQDTTSLEALSGCPSVALFVQRAEKVKPGFALTTSNSASIAAICRGLDGLPLALELAAARVRILEPAVLLQRLDHALDLLTSGDRDLPLRQRTLRATISWSYSLLDPLEQRLLRRLSVFHEGWTLEAMEQVCYGDEERHRALDDLDSLVEKGLVRVVGQGERYALLETIRAFAAEQLHAGGEVEAIRHGHASYFLAFARAVDADIKGTAQFDAVQRARGDNANMHAAIQWLTACARAGDLAALEKGLLVAGHLNWFWHMGGQHLTARSAVDALLALSSAQPPSAGRARTRLTNAMICTVLGEWNRALEESRGAYEDALAIGSEALAAEAMVFLGYPLLHEGRMAEARAAFDEGIALNASASEFFFSLGITLKGLLLFATGELSGGRALIEAARRIQERNGDHEVGGMALSFLAQMSFAEGDFAGALDLYRRSLVDLERIGDRPEIARVHSEMGWTALAGSDPRAARRSFVRAVHTNEEVGSPRGTGLALLGLAAVEALSGRGERAVAIAAAAEALSKRAGVVVDHPMDRGMVEKIKALKASVPGTTLESLVANASTLSPTAILAMIGD